MMAMMSKRLIKRLKTPKADPRPSLIICRTHIGFGLPTLQDTADAHGKPPGDEELNAAKEKMGWPTEPRFYVPDEVLAFYRLLINKGADFEKEWNKTLEQFKTKHPQLCSEFERIIKGELPENWEEQLPVFPADDKGMGSRVASGKVLNAIANVLPELMGGSADLTPSNNTWIKGGHDFQADSPDGRYIRFGVRGTCDGIHIKWFSRTSGHYALRSVIPGVYRLCAASNPFICIDGVARKMDIYP